MANSQQGEPVEFINFIKVTDEDKCFLCQDPASFRPVFNCLRLGTHTLAASRIKSMLDNASLHSYLVVVTSDLTYIDLVFCEMHEDDCRELWQRVEDGPGLLTPEVLEEFWSADVERACDCLSICSLTVSIPRRVSLAYHRQSQVIIIHRCQKGPEPSEKFVEATEFYNVYQGLALPKL